MKIKTVIVLLLWLAGTLLFAPKIDTYSYAHSLPARTSDTPVFLQLLGEARSIVSNLSLIQADVYFHGGIYKGQCGHMYRQSKEVAGEEEEHRPHVHHHEEDSADIAPYNILLRVSEQVRITEHVHLKGDQLKEIVPWLYYASEIDPHNDLAYTLTGYYLAYRLNRVQQGLSFLKKGLANNPESWRLNAEIGRLYLTKKDEPGVALRYFARAKNHLGRAPHDKFQQRYVLTYLAYCYEQVGQEDKAIPLYRQLQRIFPEQDSFREKIRELSSP
ncbi:MAG: hypothetical protein GF409_08695 [Candidatus Omnitrophica bacterium]|nr:hypothetical protein [Candidatus Omnitrophota bacterium]